MDLIPSLIVALTWLSAGMFVTWAVQAATKLAVRDQSHGIRPHNNGLLQFVSAVLILVLGLMVKKVETIDLGQTFRYGAMGLGSVWGSASDLVDFLTASPVRKAVSLIVIAFAFFVLAVLPRLWRSDERRGLALRQKEKGAASVNQIFLMLALLIIFLLLVMSTRLGDAFRALAHS